MDRQSCLEATKTGYSRCRACTRTLTTISISVYFFWSGLGYIIVASIQAGTYSPIHDALCAIDAQNMGCSNCPDILLLCEKDACWRYAMNLTIMTQADTADDDLHLEFLSAVKDAACTEEIQLATDPVDVLVGMYTRQTSSSTTGQATVTSDCSTFHCAVKEVALFNTDLNTAAGTGCTNNHGLKPSSEASDCPCSSVELTYSDSIDADTFCSATTVIALYFNEELAEKDECTQTVVNAAVAVYSSSAVDMYQDSTCQDLLQSAANVAEWFQLYDINTDSDSTYSVTTACLDVFCAAWNSTVFDCSWSTSPLLDFSSTYVDAADTYCKTRIVEMDVVGYSRGIICANAVNTTPSYCDTTTTASARSLGVATTTNFDFPASKVRDEATPCVGTSCLAGWPAPAPQVARNLQPSPTPTPSGVTASNDDYPDYTVGDYSSCTCYQQCTAGLRSRSVTCLADACREPKPTDGEECTCSHCADCHAEILIIIVMIAYFSQGGISMMCFMAFIYFQNKSDDVAIRFSIPMKIFGAAVKNLPSFVRFSVLISFFLVAYLAIICFVPSDVIAFQTDCNSVLLLQICVVISFGMSLLLLFFGRLAKLTTRRPAWFYSPVRNHWPGPLRRLDHMIRAMGP